MFGNRDLFRDFNRLFANFDVYFRDLEKDYGRGLLPSISIPSLQNSISETTAVHSDGKKTVYYKNGMVHREDGPAITYTDGNFEEYWLNGQKVTKEEVSSLKEKQEEEREHSIYIGEREYKVKGKKKLAEIQNLLE